MRRAPRPKRQGEPTIALINIVFLMLVFFLIAGTLAPPLDPEVTLATTQELDGREPPDALVLRADGRLTYRGQPVSAADHAETLMDADAPTARIVPDRDVPADRLIAVGRALQQAGITQVFIVTERGLE